MMTLRARHLMAPALKCMNSSENVVLAARRMRALGVSSIPVAGAANVFIGMVFERDIVEHCVANAVDPREMAVGDLVQMPQQTVNADQPADSAVLGLVMRQGVLPVVDAGHLVGVITLSGIASHLIDDADLEVGRMWWPTGPAAG
jgi:CBS domain-containing protein